MGLPPSSLNREAAPVVTGKTDDKTVFAVFKDWRTDPKAQARHNPWSEIDQARRLRDQTLVKFVVRASDLVGAPKTELHRSAQLWLIKALMRRQWDRKMIERYFDVVVPGRVWHVLSLEIFTPAKEVEIPAQDLEPA